ncbi:MAG: hypothetical protein C0507_13765 [Cyanobacteria bacterium PR.3.49]|nr:hypothetical protein [Cyanobacteria bacterium PR.3.49]
MPARHNQLYVTVEEYLSREEQSAIRHEYVDGRLFAMSGSTIKHNIISGNLFSLLHVNLKGGPCKVFIEAVKVRVEATNSFYYPDVMVSCASHAESAVYTEQPVLIAEVLSPSTTAIDRREKLIAYKQIPSLNEYLIVHQKKRCVEIYRRDASGNWNVCELSTGSSFEICSVAGGRIEVAMQDLYDGADGEGHSTPAVKEGEMIEDWLEEADSAE